MFRKDNSPQPSLKDELRSRLKHLMAEKLKIEGYLIDLEEQIEALQTQIMSIR